MSNGEAAKIVPMLSLRGAERAIDFYQRAFGARERSRHTTRDGRIVALLVMGDAELGVGDEVPAVATWARRRWGVPRCESVCM